MGITSLRFVCMKHGVIVLLEIESISVKNLSGLKTEIEYRIDVQMAPTFRC